MRNSRWTVITKAIGSTMVTLLLVAPWASAQGTGRPDTPALNFEAHTLGSRPVVRSLADYKGKVLLVVMWATSVH